MMAFRKVWTLAAALSLSISLSLLVGCFSPKQPACAFSCVATPNRCPENYTCGDDGLCHRTGADSACTLTPPERADAGSDMEALNDASTGGDESAGN